MLEHYYEINAGVGVHKPPSLYGAFPTDPYSHTPAGKGAQQPGMTGQVKEDVLCRFGELGVFVKDGRLLFNPCLLRSNEFLTTATDFNYVDIHGQQKQLNLAANSLGFTYCQVPVLYHKAAQNSLEIFFKDGTTQTADSLTLDADTSKKVFARTGEVTHIVVQVNESELR